MFSATGKVLSFVVCSALVLTPVLPAQQASNSAAPIPPQILSAHSVFVSNGGGSNYFEIFDGGPNRAYNTFYSQLKKIGHYELVSSPSEADLIFEIRAIAPATSGPHDITDYNPQVILTIRDPKTNVTLWTASANVRAIGTKKHRDKDFDDSVAVLVDELAQVTGQPLTTAQVKAVESNSKMPTAAKVFIISAVAGAAAMTAYGIHMIENPPKVTPPPTPSEPGSPYPY